MFCQIRCFSFVSMLKKNDNKKPISNLSIVSKNNKSEVPAKKDLHLGWVGGLFSCAN